MNKVQLTSFCMSNPEIGLTTDGKKFARIKIVSQVSYRNSNGDKTSETQSYNVIGWTHIPEMMEANFKKGIEVIVEWRLICIPSSNGKDLPEKIYVQASKVYPLAEQLLY